MRALRFVAVACAALFLVACSIGKPVPQATTYVIEPPMPASSQAVAPRPDAMRIGNVRVAAAYSGNALVYRMQEVQYTSDPYNAFIAEPAAMLSNRMAQWLDRAGPFRTVGQPGGTQSAPYMLEATVTELYGDFRPNQTPAAVVAVQFALIDMTGTRSRVVLERTLSSRVALSEASPDALVRGYGKALAEVLTQLVAEMNAIPPSSS
jgi:cholesterol transport system auxiliary component